MTSLFKNVVNSWSFNALATSSIIIYEELNDLKQNAIDDGTAIENSIIIIDDYANALP